MIPYRLVVPTAEEIPEGLGDLDGQRDRRNDGVWGNALLGGFNERNDRGVELVNDGIKFLPVGFGGHSVLGFMGESFVDIIGVDKGLAFLEGNSELADAEFVLAGADIFFRRHSCCCLVNRMNEDAGYK